MLVLLDGGNELGSGEERRGVGRVLGSGVEVGRRMEAMRGGVLEVTGKEEWLKH